jgi:hypothetical protein
MGEAMNDSDRARVLIAIGSQDSDLRNPSGAILALLAAFAAEGKVREIAEAFLMFRVAYPSNAPLVEARIPPKVVNTILGVGTTVDVKTFDRWSRSDGGKDWEKRIKNSLSTPTLFEAVVSDVRAQLMAMKTPASFRYEVREVTAGSLITWEAVEETTGHVILLPTAETAGSYLEIEEHLRRQHGVDVKLTYAPRLRDEFDQSTHTWTFRRDRIEIVVKDIPRAILRISPLA